MFDAPATTLSATPISERTTTPTGNLPRAYIAAWSGLTCLAALYITQVALESTNLPRVIATAPTTNSDERGPPAELATLRQNLTEFQRDVGRMRADLATGKPDTTTLASLSALEERMSMTTGVAIAKAASPPTQPSVAASPTPPAVAVTATAALEAWTGKPATAPDTKPLDAKSVESKSVESKPAPVEPRIISLAPPAFDKMPAPIETGSIAGQPSNPSKMTGQLPKAATAAAAAQQAAAQLPAMPAVAPQATPAPATPIAFGPAVVKAEPKPFAVQLASGTSVDEIRYSWSILSEQHPDSLSKLQPRYSATTSETAGPTYDLLAGPVKTAADAKRICKSLATRGIDCKVASYTGEAF